MTDIDIDSIEREVYIAERERKKMWRFERILRIYSVMGVVISIFAGGYFILTLIPYDLTTPQLISLTLAGAGIALAIMSRALIVIRKERLNQEKDAVEGYSVSSKLLNAWHELEEASKDALSESDSDVSRRSPRAIFSRLHEEGKLSESDLDIVEEALKMRNSIAHGKRSIPAEKAEKVVDMLFDIIRKIRSKA